MHHEIQVLEYRARKAGDQAIRAMKYARRCYLGECETQHTEADLLFAVATFARYAATIGREAQEFREKMQAAQDRARTS